MWTLLARSRCSRMQQGFDLNYVGCELRWNVDYHSQWLCLIWTMWDVNMGDLRLRGFSKQVWSELCGMWTLHPFNNSLPHERGFDLNYVGCEPVTFSHLVSCKHGFDLNYVGCEHSLDLHRVRRTVQFDLNYVGCELIDVRFKNFFL